MTNDEYLSRSFAALAHPRRAMIFRMLAEDPNHGASYQQIQSETGLADSSLVHHLRMMERNGLIRRKRSGPAVAYQLTPGEFLRITRLAQSLVTRPPLPQAA